MTQEAEVTTSMDLFEAMESLTAHRRLKPDPIPRELIEKVIFYATRAASGGNRQGWEFVVITDRDKVAEVGRHYREMSDVAGRPAAADTDPVTQRVYDSADYLAEHMGEAPCLILVCLADAQPEDRKRLVPRYGSIFPAVQNLMLAARAFGLGTVLTTRHRPREKEIKELLGIPEEVETVCLLPLGYPQRRFVHIKNRKPVAEVTHWNGW
jgi:nitroreductase